MQDTITTMYYMCHRLLLALDYRDDPQCWLSTAMLALDCNVGSRLQCWLSTAMLALDCNVGSRLQCWLSTAEIMTVPLVAAAFS
ncbi:MAG: hypothetical protein JO316_13590 [Abitibacteriaceae bacterium]|nr:hypothetical protein [Abditibacteriaceae bacterium]